MTGLHKYAMRQTFCIETGDDPDKHLSEERNARASGNGNKPTPPSQEMKIESASPAPAQNKDNRIWTQAQKQVLISAGFASNDFAAKGMLGMSNLPANATP